MSLIDNPVLFAINIEALWVECEESIVMSILHMHQKSFTYQAIVFELTGLCGFAYN